METPRFIQLPFRSHPAAEEPMDLDEPSQPLCSFLDLPAEIRNDIYLLLLTSSVLPALRRIVAQNHYCRFLLPALPISTAILSTCRQIYTEAGPMLYTLNTFAASPTLLTSLPFLVCPSRPIIYPSICMKIRRWYVNIRLDCDPRFSEEDVTKAFTGADELEVEASQATFRGATMGVLLLFKEVRGVRSAKVHGSVERPFAEWLERCMMGKPGSVFEDNYDGDEKRVVGGELQVYSAWEHGNR